MGDHVGIPGVVLLLLFAFMSAHVAFYACMSFLLLGLHSFCSNRLVAGYFRLMHAYNIRYCSVGSLDSVVGLFMLCSMYVLLNNSRKRPSFNNDVSEVFVQPLVELLSGRCLLHLV